MSKIRWGIMGTAKIARKKVIPAMQKSKYTHVLGIASRSLRKAQKAADSLGIDRGYSSYEDMLEDDDIEAVYIPLPNHLHVLWSKRALKSGKHVLCEKPIGLNSKEAQELLEFSQKYPNQLIMEAFMYKFHLQWQQAKEFIKDGTIGEPKFIHSIFSYFNDDPNNIRNIPEIGGGGLMDIGCYCISLSRFVFEEEPISVFGNMNYDPTLKIDRLTNAILKFRSGTSTFTCGTQQYPCQYVNIVGERGKIEIESPFNPDPDKPTNINISTDEINEMIRIEQFNQYRKQADVFSQAILKGQRAPVPLEDAVANMKVIDDIFLSSSKYSWVQ